MAIGTGSLIEVAITLGKPNEGQMNVWQYLVLDFTGIPLAAEIGQAWWNNCKATYRALALATWGQNFQKVSVRELNNPTGEYGEYSISSSEQAGTRSSPTDSDPQPAFVAVGVRLSVSTRATRPGQKRFGFLTQTDCVGNTLQSAYKGLLDSHMGVMVAQHVLGAPALGVVLVPHVVRKDTAGFTTANQAILGYAINDNVTSQVSRRIGRGM